MIQEKGWYILNSKTRGDWEKEYTYIGARGTSVIDYIIVNEIVMDKRVEFRIEERVDSDHTPLRMEMTEEKEERTEEEEGEEEEEEDNQKKRKVFCWDEEAKRRYRKLTEDRGSGEEMEIGSVEERWRKIKERVHKCMVYKKISTGRK